MCHLSITGMLNPLCCDFRGSCIPVRTQDKKTSRSHILYFVIFAAFAKIITYAWCVAAPLKNLNSDILQEKTAWTVIFRLQKIPG